MMKKLFKISIAWALAALVSVPALAQSRDFKVGASGTLHVDVDSGELVINVVPGSQVSVRARGIDENDPRFRSFQKGGDVYVEYRRERRRGWGWNSDARFEISIPPGFSLDLATSSGDVVVNGDLQGQVRGRTAGGDMEVGNVAGPVFLRTAGGDIEAGALEAEAEIKTSGGDIAITRVGGRLDAHTSGGDIDVGDVGAALEAKTSGGSIEVGNVAGDARMTTAGGDIRAKVVSGGAEMKTAGGEIEIQAAFGHVQAKTAGGDVILSEVTGSLSASTAGGQVEAYLIPEGGRESEMRSAGGDLVLYLPAGAQVTVEAEIEKARDERGWWRGKGDREYDIYSDFEAASYQRDAQGGSVHAVYHVNGGGPMVRMKTSHGNIEIRARQ